MVPHPEAGDDTPPIVRVANVLIVIALVAMLIGAVVLLLARDHDATDIAPKDEEPVLDRGFSDGDLLGAHLEIRITHSSNTTSNVTLTSQETSTGRSEIHELAIPPGSAAVWKGRAWHGEHWIAHVENDSNGTVRASVTVGKVGHYQVGGILVGIGALGFVFHRVGMRRSD